MDSEQEGNKNISLGISFINLRWLYGLNNKNIE